MTNKRVGVVGGYGQVGIEVVNYLLKKTDYSILIGGRNKKKAEFIVEKQSGRISFVMVDIFNQDSLDNFCKECDLVINCAGPSWRVVDRVAVAALNQGLHYVDTGGYQPLYKALSDKQEEIKSKDLTFIAAAGLLPGISGVLANYLAQHCFDRVYHYEVYYAGQDRWSLNSAYDIISSMENSDGKGAMYYDNGEFKKAGFFSFSKKIDLPKPAGKKRMFLFFTPELQSIIKTNKIRTLYAYTVNTGKFVPKVMAYIKIFKKFKNHDEKLRSAKLMVKAAALDLKHSAPYFIMKATMKGTENGKIKECSATLVVEDTYKLTGIATAYAALFILEGNISETGWSLLAENVDAKKFINRLEQDGFSPSFS